MPKLTFLNLPDEKRKRIEEIAIDEFVDHGFEAASISQIVSRCGIAKGSFYQYFKDKNDLFLYLVDLSGREKQKYFSDNKPPKEELEFFEYLRWLFEIGYAYPELHSKLNQAINRVLFGEGMFLSETFRQARDKSANMFKILSQQAVEKGEINPAIDSEIVAFVVETLLNSLGLFILSQQTENLLDPKQGNLDLLLSEKARHIVDSLLKVLEYGLRNPQMTGKTATNSHSEDEHESGR